LINFTISHYELITTQTFLSDQFTNKGLEEGILSWSDNWATQRKQLACKVTVPTIFSKVHFRRTRLNKEQL